MKRNKTLFILVSVFSIAMGFLESAVVIYLRELIYPGGFHFPLVLPDENLILTELLREASTLIILLALGIIAGKTISQKFAWFIYSFAVWDIFYYIFLKLLINWPESIFSWDILFLIPITWTAPVLSPVLVSLTFILFAVIILYFAGNEADTKLLFHEWGLFIIGCLMLFLSFIRDYSKFILQHSYLKKVMIYHDRQSYYKTVASFIPEKYNWTMFALGEVIILLAIFFYFIRMERKVIKQK